MKKDVLAGILLGLAFVFTTILIVSPSPIAAQGGHPPKIGIKGATTIPVYRFYYHYGKVDGPHVYRTVPNIPSEGWQGEGIAYYVSPVQLQYTVPLYVVYGPGLDHFYTIDITARDHCIKNLGYKDEGVLGYVMPKAKDYPGTSPLYRWVRAWTIKEFAQDSSHFQDHFYMTGSSPVANYGFEGIECNVWTQKLNLPYKLFEWSGPAIGTTWHVNDNPVFHWKVWSGEGYSTLSYSKNNGASWHPIATVANTGTFGDVNEQSYSNWKVPAEATGKIKIKIAWTKENNGASLPWAADISTEITVVPAALRVVRRP